MNFIQQQLAKQQKSGKSFSGKKMNVKSPKVLRNVKQRRTK